MLKILIIVIILNPYQKKLTYVEELTQFSIIIIKLKYLSLN